MATHTASATRDRLGLMRLEVDDDWSTADFAEFLGHLDLAVQAIWRLIAIEFDAQMYGGSTNEGVISASFGGQDPQALVDKATEVGGVGLIVLKDRVVVVTQPDAIEAVTQVVESFGLTVEDAARTIETVSRSVKGLETNVEHVSWPDKRSQMAATLRRWLDRKRSGIVDSTGSGVRASEETPPPPPLVLRSVRLESPGWIEVVQSLNPLKVVENLITRWRHENTLRTKQRDAAESARRQDELGRQKIMMAYQLELLKQLSPQLREGVYAPQFSKPVWARLVR